MVFQVPASKASVKQNVFEFTLPGEKKPRTLPKMQYINADIRHRFSQLYAVMKPAQDAGQAIDEMVMLEYLDVQYELLEQYNPGIHKILDGEQLGAIVQAWIEASSVSMGESPASAD